MAGNLGVNATWGQVDWAGFVLQHLREQSVLLQMGATLVPVVGRQRHYPRSLTDGQAVWVAEGAPIPSSAPTGDDIVLTPKKLANVVTLSNEAIDDAAVGELDQVGQALTRAVATAVDAAAFSNAAATATTPAGLLNYAIPAQTGGVADVDSFLSAIGTIEGVGGVPNAIVMNPADKTSLTLVKEAAGWERPLLQPDPTLGGRYSIGGAPIWSTSKMAATKSLICQASEVVVGIRRDISVAFSTDSAFTSDSTVARVTFRADWAWNDVRGAVLVGP